MLKNDGTPDLRYKANRTGSSGVIPESERNFFDNLRSRENAEANMLRAFRAELLNIEPDLFTKLFKLAENNDDWYSDNVGLEFGLTEFKWLLKKTPELHTIASIKNDREQNMDAYEKKIEDRTSGLLGAHFGDIENLLKAFLENKIAIGISGNKALFEKNINILDGIISKALSVEKKIIRELQEKEKRYQEKSNTQFQDWIKKYGYCTSNVPYEGSYPLTKSKLKSIKTKIKEEDDFQGENWLEEINLDSDKIIRLQHLSKEEILYIKKNFVSADENNCDLEIERRSKLKLWEKLYEMIFIRI